MRPRLTHRPFIEMVLLVWQQHPDMRFGQLLMNVSRDEDGTFPDTWNWEDSEWLDRLEAYLREKVVVPGGRERGAA